ncbi:MAG TPA: peptidoglycan-binding protein, partial [Thermohalobaculum sp.]|nr:peptidoglycan-binding protein [Thermohalobaculum sp.]
MGVAGAESAPEPETIAVGSTVEPADQSATHSPGDESLRIELAQKYNPASAEQRFYESRGYLPVWLSEDGSTTQATQALISWAGAADANALPVDRYGVSDLVTRLERAASGTLRDAAALEVALTRLFLTYGRDISSGLLEPRDINRNIDVRPRRPDPAVLLAGIGATEDVAGFLDALVPAHPDYERLVAQYAQMREIAQNGDWGPQIAKGNTLQPDDRSPRVEELRARLIAMGDLLPDEKIAASDVINDATPRTTDPQFFDPALEAAVRRFQARHGLNMDGAVGPMTLGAINTSAAERTEQIAVNLERMRWLNYDLGARHIFINTAGFTMSMIENGATRFSTRAV